MKVRHTISATAILLLVLSIGGSGQSDGTLFTLFIKAEKDRVRVGEAVRVEVTMANRSERLVTVLTTSPLDDYVFEVRGGDGNLVPDTGLMRTLKGARKPGTSVHRYIATKLKPGEATEDTLEVSAFCDMKQPGNYAIQVQRKLPAELGSGMVKSNTVTVTIAP